MTLHSSTLFSLLGEKVRWSVQRQQVLAENIANADTPNFKSRDIKMPNFSRMVKKRQSSFQIMQTQKEHMPSIRSQNDYPIRTENRPYETDKSGNSVVLEEQLMKMNKTVADHRLAVNLTQKYVSLYRIALGRGGGRG